MSQSKRPKEYAIVDPSDISVPDSDDLRALRILAGVTLDEAAAQLDVELNTIWRWEQGRQSPRLCHVQQLVSYYRDEIDGQTQLV